MKTLKGDNYKHKIDIIKVNLLLRFQEQLCKYNYNL